MFILPLHDDFCKSDIGIMKLVRRLRLAGDNYKQTWSGYNITAPVANASAVLGTSQYIYTPLVNDILQQCGLQKK